MSSRQTILVVEDNKYQLLLYKQELSLEGYNIITAKDDSEAVKKLQEHAPALVVMNIIIPKMDFFESMGRIINERKKIPIIINTAYSCYKDNFMSWGADAYIIKSSDLSELKNKIKELLGNTE
ncbi:MAG: response regulator [Candidatus Brocadiaceae bacterium]|nr:response regulator [Candidatus Brocadiaceae bacterium]